MNVEEELNKLQCELNEIRKADVELFKSFVTIQESILNLYASAAYHVDNRKNSPIARQNSTPVSPVSRHDSLIVRVGGHGNGSGHGNGIGGDRHDGCFSNPVVSVTKPRTPLRSFTFSNGKITPMLRRYYSIGSEVRRALFLGTDTLEESYDEFDDSTASPADCCMDEVIFSLASQNDGNFKRLDQVELSVYEEAFKTSISQWKGTLSAESQIKNEADDVATDESAGKDRKIATQNESALVGNKSAGNDMESRVTQNEPGRLVVDKSAGNDRNTIATQNEADSAMVGNKSAGKDMKSRVTQHEANASIVDKKALKDMQLCVTPNVSMIKKAGINRISPLVT